MGQPIDIEHLYRAHSHMVLRRARRLLGSEPDAREVVQEVFLSLIERPGQFDHRSAITTWLYRVTTNNCLKKLRSRNVRDRLDATEVAFRVDTRQGARAESMAAAAQSLRRLPDKLARLAVYYHLDEMTHAEIAEVMGCSRRQVGYLLNKLHRAVQKQEAA